jgi:hypothetical protein
MHGFRLPYFRQLVTIRNTTQSGVIDPAESNRIFTKFFVRNYEIVKQFKNFMRNFSGVIDPAETISYDPAEI